MPVMELYNSAVISIPIEVVIYAINDSLIQVWSAEAFGSRGGITNERPECIHISKQPPFKTTTKDDDDFLDVSVSSSENKQTLFSIQRLWGKSEVNY